jgi:hypothetical protein
MEQGRCYVRTATCIEKGLEEISNSLKKQGLMSLLLYLFSDCIDYFFGVFAFAILVAKSLPALNLGNFLALILITSPV